MIIRGLDLHRRDERLDRDALRAVLAVISLGMAFLFAMMFFSFPEWIRPRAFAPAGDGLAATLSVQHRWGPYGQRRRVMRGDDPVGPDATVEVTTVVTGVSDRIAGYWEQVAGADWPSQSTATEEIPVIPTRGGSRVGDFDARDEADAVGVPMSQVTVMAPPDPSIVPAEPVGAPPGTVVAPPSLPPSGGSPGNSPGSPPGARPDPAPCVQPSGPVCMPPGSPPGGPPGRAPGGPPGRAPGGPPGRASVA